MASISVEIEFMAQVLREKRVLSHAGIAFVEADLPDIVLDMTM